jgi:hypothetical protein
MNISLFNKYLFTPVRKLEVRSSSLLTEKSDSQNFFSSVTYPADREMLEMQREMRDMGASPGEMHRDMGHLSRRWPIPLRICISRTGSRLKLKKEIFRFLAWDKPGVCISRGR